MLCFYLLTRQLTRYSLTSSYLCLSLPPSSISHYSSSNCAELPTTLRQELLSCVINLISRLAYQSRQSPQLHAMASFAPVDDSLASPSPSSRKVAYFYDADVGLYQYSQDHPMRPWRVRMTHNLVVQYDLPRRMEVYVRHPSILEPGVQYPVANMLQRARPATALEMTRFHTDDYIDFLRRVTPETVNNFHAACERHAVGDQDCPVFDGMFGLAQISAGGSMEAAARINIGDCDTAINWAGGLHHAKKDTAGGFCYVNGNFYMARESIADHY